MTVMHRQTGLPFCGQQFPTLAMAKRFVDHVGPWQVEQAMLGCKTTGSRLTRYARLLLGGQQ